jgi:hypothetical protein
MLPQRNVRMKIINAAMIIALIIAICWTTYIIGVAI